MKERKKRHEILLLPGRRENQGTTDDDRGPNPAVEAPEKGGRMDMSAEKTA